MAECLVIVLADDVTVAAVGPIADVSPDVLPDVSPDLPLDSE